ncbi:MAG: sugar phosphate isomerase/epimerase [Firmicutes bacterium]|jgi:hexulose-6-phosphate isomerase|nr:sugar phosphate isomerase/epimerase [Bacillota bacterium]
MKIGVSQIIVPGGVDNLLQLCRDAGYEAVELSFGEGRDPDINLDGAGLKDIVERCRQAGVVISSLIARYKQGSFLSSDPNLRDWARKSLSRALEIAEVLGAKTVLLHPGQVEASASYLETYDRFIEDMRGMAAEAEGRKVNIGIENVWNRFMLSPKEACDIVYAINSPWIGVYLDTGNMMAYGYPEQWIRDLAHRIKAVHFKDFKRREHRFVPLMEGDCPWPEVMEGLRSVGYTGAVVHEVSGDRELQIEMAKRMRRIVAGETA